MARLPGVEPPDRLVCHVDMDCFYAACERLREPDLEGEPVVVGMGYEPGTDHGAVATASYEAREHGIESAMAVSEALERLPRRETAEGRADTAVYRPVDMEFYESVSETVRDALEDVPGTVRNVSIDEAYLDPDGVSWDDAATFGRSLKRDIESAAGVEASVGIAPDMTTAKLASDAEKPDGLVVVTPEAVRSFLAPMAVESLHGVGPVTARELGEMGFETAGDIAAADASTLVAAFGERGRDLHAQARGEDGRPVEPKGRPKSLSSESAFVEATAKRRRKRETVRALAMDVAERASTEDVLYKTIGIKIVRPPFDVHTRSRSLPGPIEDPELIESIALDLLGEFEGKRVRKLGVRVSNLSFDERKQATIGEWGDGADGTDASESSACGSGEARALGQVTLSRFE
ncbi:DNA polymerase Y family protein [Natronomonas sp.]|uniref:DNA polymerase Y family protein n=1 Tax=Natronomonas sp. TaxID=2184060 RepID=UPI002614A19F|nr:DNA polymerase IV [Natronomonas sp.]